MTKPETPIAHQAG